jgi:hypothetical protein
VKHDRLYGVLILAVGISLAGAGISRAATCTPTGFYVDGINMTAAMINPGSVTSIVDATGCNIGIYYDDGTDGGTVGGTVNGASVSGANYFGIVVNGGGGSTGVTVNVSNSTVESIGENPPNGTQHGNAIFYINGSTDASADDSRTCSTAAGATTNDTISGNTVSGYQKNGITAKCPGVSVIISDNEVQGAGPVDYIAENGIELGQGATGTISNNTVSDNQYTGTNGADSSGVLVFGGGPFGALAVGAHVTGNTLTNNDVGIFAVNCGDASCDKPPSVPTVEIIQKNSLANDAVTNVSGCGGTQGYQAAISDFGRNDQISKNAISGAGYTPSESSCTGSGPAAVFAIDTTGSNSKVHKNVTP